MVRRELPVPLHRMLRAILALSLAVLFSLSSPPARAATPEQVDEAIKKAQKFLRSQQKKDGSWPEPDERQFGGHTSMATYALLASGDSPQDEHIKRAVQWLGNAKITGIYALGLRAQVWPYLERGPDVRAAVTRDAELLLKAADNHGRFAYTTDKGEGAFFHNSTTQYGVLGLWACARAGYEVPTKFWQISEQGWWACQDPKTGGWAYRSVVPGSSKEPQAQVRATMTAAGVASLFVAQDYLRANEGIRCNGNVTNPRIEAGMKWMADHFDGKTTNGYLLYGIERIGVASGYKYFGKHDWYAAGSDALVKKQGKDGSWEDHGKVPGTSFGIFFLTRGRAPIVMNKLQYEFDVDPKKRQRASRDVANWNQRPRDAANAVRWIGENMERDLNWQIVNLRVGAADLLDAPLLYVAGDQVLRLSPDDKQKLKSYVEQGGIILGQADCAKTDFTKSFKALGKELFPAYDFRPLPQSHFVFNEQFNAAKWKDKIEVEGLSNGVRELMLLIPKDDVSRTWQTFANKQHHFEVMSNIFLYAVDKSNLRNKGETYVLTPDPKATPRRTIKVARVMYGGNWDPEPGGWRRFGTHLLNTFKLGVAAEPVQPGGAGDVAVNRAAAAPAPKSDGKGRQQNAAKSKPGAAAAVKPASLSLKGYDVAHLTGTDTFELSDAARAEIRTFVESGGTLLVDAAGGSTAFAAAAEIELAKIFKDGDAALAQPLKPDHDLYKLPASKVNEVAYRQFARDKIGKGLKSPRLRGIPVKERPAVFYSKEDLSTGLVGQPVDGVFGYDPKSATQLVTNVILFATNEANTATQPAPGAKPAAKSGAPADKPAGDKPEPKDDENGANGNVAGKDKSGEK